MSDSHRAVCFVFERASAPRHVLLGKGHPMMKLQICTGAFPGHQGNDQGTQRQSPLLLREVIGLHHFPDSVAIGCAKQGNN